MRKIIGFFIDNARRISILFLFLIAISVIFFLIPKEIRYKFEYQKGKPWLHETLFAPFDFPINKTDKQIQFEKDSLLKNSPQYFIHNKEIFSSKIDEFKINFNEVWDSTYKIDSTEILKLFTNVEHPKSLIYSWCSSLLSDVYNNPGIIEVPDSVIETIISNSIIYVQKANVEEEFQFSSFRNQTNAIEYVNKQVNEFIINKFDDSKVILRLFQDLYISKYIVPNTNFDKETYLSTQEQLINSISLTHGMINAGDKIIAYGEIVNNEKFNILESLRSEYELTTYNPALIIGQTTAVFICILMIFMFLLNFRKDVLEHFTKTMFILSLIIIFVIVARLTLNYNVISVYLVPFTLLPIIIRAFYDSRLALFIHNITMLLIGFFMPNSFEFIFLQIIAGMVAIFSLANVKRRGQLFMAAVFIFLAYCIVYLGIAVVQEGSFENIRWRNLSWFAGNGIMILAAYPLIYIFEKIFGFLSDVTLMELADTNQPLLRNLAEKAPGTFQHSMQVANLAEEVIYKIGGNSLLIRAGALYHDIGKMSLPHFFIENQSPGLNPHDEIDLEKSAEIITGHVQYGIETARKHQLPEQVIDFIRSHHGNTKVQYFYKTFIKKFPNSEIDLQKFTYKGQPPTTKETAVLMMADAIEASARTLKSYSEQSINELVESIINYQMAEKQFDNASITLREIFEAKEIFKKKLKNIYHSRIEYPK